MQDAATFVSLYHWYKMPPIIHEILQPRSQIISYFIVQIVQRSQETQENLNKDMERHQALHFRKFSRAQTMEELFHNILRLSDSLTYSMKIYTQKNINKVFKMLHPQILHNCVLFKKSHILQCRF